jgi:FAD binding domain
MIVDKAPINYWTRISLSFATVCTPNGITNRPICDYRYRHQHGHFSGANLSLSDSKDSAFTVEALIRATAALFTVGNIYDVAPLPTWHRGRVGLIGDAAHAVSPNSGQGASLALEDALCLAQTLRGAVPAEQAFAQFEAMRRERVEKIIAHGRRAGEDKKVEGALALWLRDRLVALAVPWVMRRNRWIYDYRLTWTG